MVRLTKLIFVLISLQLIIALEIFSQTIIFQDDMNGDNSITGLEARGWTVWDLDGGGTNPAWYQGNFFIEVFPSYEGQANGYVASDWTGTNDSDIVDHWLISQEISVSSGDELSFWIRSGNQSFLDTLYIYISEDGTTNSLTLVSFLEVPKNDWFESGYTFTNDGTILFGFRYYVFDSNVNGDYIGIDDVKIISTSGSSGAELDLQSVSVSSLDWQVGSSITADLTVQNIGSASAASHITQLYLSVDQTINNEDTPIGNPITVNSLAAGSSTTFSETFSVPSITTGTFYLGIIVDINNNVPETDEGNNTYYWLRKIVVGFPASITLSNAVSFGNSDQSSSYRMLGIPGNINIPITETLSGVHEEDWVAYHDNGNTTDYLIAHDGTTTFNFKPGNGFWILAHNNFTINQSANSVELQSEQLNSTIYEIVYPISLHTGWNIISNPFVINASWDDVKLFNTVNEDLHSFNGSFSTTSILQPYTGYYFYNVNNLTQLYIPYPSSSNNPGSITKKANETNDIIITLLQNKLTKSKITIGFHDDAKIAYDAFDRFAPPADFEDFRLSLFNDNLETSHQYLLTDYRPLSLDGEIYSVNLKTKSNENITIDFDIPEKFQDSEVYLVNHNSNLINMKTSKSIEFLPMQSVYELTILIGSQEFIDDKRSEFLPKEFSLSQNYPNPFNPTTNIEFDIPKSEFVKLEIYDAIGQKITTLVNKNLNAGSYTEQWNAKDHASGIYYVKLTAGTNVKTKKLVLMK